MRSLWEGGHLPARSPHQNLTEDRISDVQPPDWWENRLVLCKSLFIVFSRGSLSLDCILGTWLLLDLVCGGPVMEGPVPSSFLGLPSHRPPGLVQVLVECWEACWACSHLPGVLKQVNGWQGLGDIPGRAPPPTCDFHPKPLGRKVAIQRLPCLCVLALLTILS